MNKKILITGANGFVGQQVIKYYSDLDAEITLILRRQHDNFTNNPVIHSIITTDDMFNESTAWWEDACQNIDIVIHLAWYVEPGKYLESSLNNSCYKGTISMMEGAARAGIKRFVGVGTCFEYAFLGLPLDIDSPLDPQTSYAKAKVDTFKYLTNFCNSHKIEFLWCRLFYLFGEGEHERRLVPVLRKKLLEGKIVELVSGDKVKDYLDVKDAGRIIGSLAINKHTGPYNVCSGKGVTMRAFTENIADDYNNGRNLLKFDAIDETNFYDPPFVVGKKTDANF